MHSSNGNNKKKRVLHILGILNRGGAEFRTLEFIMRNRNTDAEYDVVLLSGVKGVLDKEFAEVIGGQIHYIKLNRAFFPAYIKLLRTRKYDVIHSHVLMVSSIFLMIAWFLGVKTRVAQLHSTGSKNVPLSRSIRDFFLRRILLMFSTDIIPVSESVAKAIYGENWRNHKKIEVVYSGFISNPNNAVSYGRIIKIGHVGRFHEAKNHPFLADVFKEICDTNDNVVCSMAGRLDNVIYPEVEQKLRKYIQTGKVIIQGDISNVPDMMKNLDIMITTSLWEGLPGVILEAVSSGVPVLASEIEPNREVAGKVKGVRIMNGWNKEEWRDALIAMINELTAQDKKKLVHDIQDSFIQSPFYYKNADKQLLDVYKVRTFPEPNPSLTVA